MAEDAVVQKAQELFPDESFKEMLDAGLFYGRPRRHLNPKMQDFTLANRGGIEIINLAKVLDGMNLAAAFLAEKVKSSGLILFVGTQPAAHGIVALAKEFGFPYVSNRWLGGTLTNFKIISKRVEHLKKLRSDLVSGALDKYTKKERVEFDREIKRLEELLGGLENLARKPDALVVIDPVLHLSAVREAVRAGVPVIAFSNIDANPDLIDYPVVGNNKARKSIAWFLSKIGEAIRGAIAARPVMAVSTNEK